MARDPEFRAHQEWLGYVQPVGLVVSPPALLAAQAQINRNVIPGQRRFLECLEDVELVEGQDKVPAVTDLPKLLQDVFEWEAQDLIGSPGMQGVPSSLSVVLPDYDETLRPTYAVKEIAPAQGAQPWLMLIQSLKPGTDLDEVADRDEHRWQANPQARFERLLRETQVPIGLLANGTHLRLVYAPRGETSGYATFAVQAMSEVSGRPIFAALHMLLSAERLFTLPEKQRLPALLAESRKYQNYVSTQLARQVLAALYELLRGSQAGNEARKGELLREVLAQEPDHVYRGLLAVLMRMVFILYAEDRGLMPRDGVYVNHYSLNGLFERLRADAGRYPDTMDQRFGAWAQLLTLFRLVYDGARYQGGALPARHGHLFDPDRYNFLEGRSWKQKRQRGQKEDPPRISDGVIYRVLENLLILDGERLSYRTLDVEQIGSVYETIMGFTLQVASGRSIAVKPKKPHGAPVVVNLDELLKVEPDKRAKWLRDASDQEVAGDGLKQAATIEALVAALERKIAKEATPSIVPRNAMVLQPSDERRRSGSHYTPRSLTEPIVEKTLKPILDRLGPKPTPEQILDLKICDPAMGSGAFLVAVCRWLAEVLVRSWHAHNQVPKLPPDEDELLYARRLVAQRCLYGVDKNPMAVDLAKLSLWLATLAKDHPFTFLDHALRAGDSLVGLTRKQIGQFDWDDARSHHPVFGQDELARTITRVTEARREILQMAEDNVYSVALKRQKLADADGTLQGIRDVGDMAIAAFFAGSKDKERAGMLEGYRDICFEARRGNADALRKQIGILAALRGGKMPVTPFHWEIEFPEVFGRENGGFDAMVGNPPFMGGMKISTSLSDSYLAFLKFSFPEGGDRTDLVAYFFRKAIALLRISGAFGLVATNTIAQGDTRRAGLGCICNTLNSSIFCADRRKKWPGVAAVIVSVVHVFRGPYSGPKQLDGEMVSAITPFLFSKGSSTEPVHLLLNKSKAFIGCNILGPGFTFEENPADPRVNSMEEMRRILQKSRRNQERIYPYIGGEEVNSSPAQSNLRFVIDFGEMSEEEARRWPDLFEVVTAKVLPERRMKQGSYSKYWWRFGRSNKDGRRAIADLPRMLAATLISNKLSFVFLSTNVICSHKLCVFAFSSWNAFAVLQSRAHEIWAWAFSSTMKDDLNYTPTDCFETYPFPRDFETSAALEAAGKEYYEFRAALMVKNNEGLTKTYNRFHDPNETSPDILKLRELHAVMDRAVLDAYGWTDLKPTHDFILDYEEDDDDEEGGGRQRTRKKPWRYRWPDDFRDEVLARLLELNRKYAEEERLHGADAQAAERKSAGRAGKKQRPKSKAGDETGSLL